MLVISNDLPQQFSHLLEDPWVWRLNFSNDSTQLLALIVTKDLSSRELFVVDWRSTPSVWMHLGSEDFWPSVQFLPPHFAPYTIALAEDHNRLRLLDDDFQDAAHIDIPYRFYDFACSPNSREILVAAYGNNLRGGLGLIRLDESVEMNPLKIRLSETVRNILLRYRWRIQPGAPCVSWSGNHVACGYQKIMFGGKLEDDAVIFESLFRETNELTPTFSPDGASIVGFAATHARVWPFSPGKPRKLFDIRGHAGNIQVVQFTPDCSRILTGSEDGTIRSWDAETGVPLEQYDWGTGPVQTLAVAPNGSVAAAAGTGENLIVVWDL